MLAVHSHAHQSDKRGRAGDRLRAEDDIHSMDVLKVHWANEASGLLPVLPMASPTVTDGSM